MESVDPNGCRKDGADRGWGTLEFGYQAGEPAFLPRVNEDHVSQVQTQDGSGEWVIISLHGPL